MEAGAKALGLMIALTDPGWPLALAVGRRDRNVVG